MLAQFQAIKNIALKMGFSFFTAAKNHTLLPCVCIPEKVLFVKLRKTGKRLLWPCFIAFLLINESQQVS